MMKILATYKINFRHTKSKSYRTTYKGNLFITNDKSVFLDEKLAKWLEIEIFQTLGNFSKSRFRDGK